MKDNQFYEKLRKKVKFSLSIIIFLAKIFFIKIIIIKFGVIYIWTKRCQECYAYTYINDT